MADTNNNLSSGSNVNFVYDSANNIENVNEVTTNYKTNYEPGSIIFQNVSGTAILDENDLNNYKGLYIVDKNGEEKELSTIFSNRLKNYVCSSKSGEDLEINENDTVQEAISKLHKSILDIEYVIAAALNDINARLNKLNV